MIDAIEFLEKQKKKIDIKDCPDTDSLFLDVNQVLEDGDDLIISDIKYQKKNKDRLSIFVNGKFLIGLYDEVVIGFGLAKGKVITYEELNSLLYEDLKIKAMRKSLSLLSYKPRTEREMCDKLRENEYDDEIIGVTIEKLLSLGYINDYDYALSYIESRLSAYGMYRIKSDLFRKGISSEIIEKAVSDSEVDQSDEIRELFAKKLKSCEGLTNEKRYNRVMSYMLRKGFDYGSINKLFEEFDIRKY